MDILRTPADRFEGLPDWPYSPVFTDVDAGDGSGARLRVAHYETGPADAAETILCMHGEPTWSYLYRKMAPGLVAAGHRVVMPDLVGFGASDKPAALADYTYERHVAWMSEWLTGNDLRGLTFFGQDWGGLIGLRLVTAHPDRFSRIIVSNTGLPVANREPSEAFRKWQKYSQAVPVFDVGSMVNSTSAQKLTAAEVAAYDAPYPDESFKAGARIFPSLYPDGDDHPSNIANAAAWKVLESWTKPALTCFGDSDPLTRGGDRPFRERIPGAAGQPHAIVEGGRHFIQEDKPAELVAIINGFVAGNPV
jgi:haloalkane dehalogenase